MTASLRAALSAPALLLLFSVSLSSPAFAQPMPLEATAAIAAPVETTTITPAARPFAAARPYDSLIASHAAANGIPVELVHRVVVRESRYRAGARGRGGATGLMQIKLATARSMGYSGTAAGLLDPATNLTYGVRYLAGAYRAAKGHHGRAIGYYASGFRGAARPARAYAKASPQEITSTLSADAAATPFFVQTPVVVQERPVRRKRR